LLEVLMPDAKPRRWRAAALDETKLKDAGQQFYVWAAIDVKTRDPQAFRDHGLRWRHQAFGLRNRIERWFRTLKDRTRRFYNNFQTRRGLIRVRLFLHSSPYGTTG
jgi:transposase-like protein